MFHYSDGEKEAFVFLLARIQRVWAHEAASPQGDSYSIHIVLI